MVLFLILSTIQIKVTTRVQLIVGIVTVAVIVLVDLVTTAKGGSHGQALSAFSFQPHQLGRLHRRLLRDHLGRDVLHRFRDRRRLR